MFGATSTPDASLHGVAHDKLYHPISNADTTFRDPANDFRQGHSKTDGFFTGGSAGGAMPAMGDAQCEPMKMVGKKSRSRGAQTVHDRDHRDVSA